MTAYLGLGSNLGDRLGQMRDALGRLRELGEVTGVSSVWETAPVGHAGQPDYLNAVIRLETDLSPGDLLVHTQAIEGALGRERPFPNAPRTIDIDILLVGDVVRDEPALRLPHPRMLERAFVLRPLAELAPDLVHPVTGRTIAEHLAAAEGLERAERIAARADRD